MLGWSFACTFCGGWSYGERCLCLGVPLSKVCLSVLQAKMPLTLPVDDFPPGMPCSFQASHTHHQLSSVELLLISPGLFPSHSLPFTLPQAPTTAQGHCRQCVECSTCSHYSSPHWPQPSKSNPPTPFLRALLLPCQPILPSHVILCSFPASLRLMPLCGHFESCADFSMCIIYVNQIGFSFADFLHQSNWLCSHFASTKLALALPCLRGWVSFALFVCTAGLTQPCKQHPRAVGGHLLSFPASLRLAFCFGWAEI